MAHVHMDRSKAVASTVISFQPGADLYIVKMTRSYGGQRFTGPEQRRVCCSRMSGLASTPIAAITVANCPKSAGQINYFGL